MNYLDCYLMKKVTEINLFLESVKELTSEEKPLTCKEFLNTFLSTFLTPEKLNNILEKEDIKEYIEDLVYNKEEKTLTVGGVSLEDITKLLFLSWLTIFYYIKNIENIDKVKSPFLNKSLEAFSQTFKRISILSDYNINHEILENNFEKIFADYITVGLLCYAMAIISLQKNLSLLKPTILEYKLIIHAANGTLFAQRLFLFLRKIGKFIGINTEYLSIELYNNLFAVGITDVPLSELNIEAIKDLKEEKEEEI